MTAGTITTSKLQALVDAIQPIIDGNEADGCGNIVFYYSPKAQAALHKKNPKNYGEKPKWNFDILEQVEVPGTDGDDFAWYRYDGTGLRVRAVDPTQQPVQNLEYQLTTKDKKVIANGKTNADGHHRIKIKEHVKHGDPVTLYVKNIRQEWQKLKDFLFDSDAFFISLTSPKTKYSVTLKKVRWLWYWCPSRRSVSQKFETGSRRVPRNSSFVDLDDEVNALLSAEGARIGVLF
jgi:hypothetical protein